MDMMDGGHGHTRTGTETHRHTQRSELIYSTLSGLVVCVIYVPAVWPGAIGIEPLTGFIEVCCFNHGHDGRATIKPARMPAIPRGRTHRFAPTVHRGACG